MTLAMVVATLRAMPGRFQAGLSDCHRATPSSTPADLHEELHRVGAAVLGVHTPLLLGGVGVATGCRDLAGELQECVGC